MKKDKNIFVLLVKEIAVYAAGVILAAGFVVGFFYGANLIAEVLSDIVTVEMGLFMIFAIAGTALYIDFRPEKKKSHVNRARHGGNKAHSALAPASHRMLKAYSVK